MTFCLSVSLAGITYYFRENRQNQNEEFAIVCVGEQARMHVHPFIKMPVKADASFFVEEEEV